MTPLFSASEVVWNGAVRVLAERCMRAQHHPETQPAAAKGSKSQSMRISALAQTTTNACNGIRFNRNTHFILKKHDWTKGYKLLQYYS